MRSAALRAQPRPAPFEEIFVAAERIILIRGYNLNLADVYLGIYGAFPEPGARVRFVLAGNIGSRSPAIAALATGEWPAGVVLALDVNGYRIGGAVATGS